MFGKIKVTNFAKRHFEMKSGGTKITDKTVEEFEEILNGKVFDIINNPHSLTNRTKILKGYSPFCKLISIDNFTNARIGSMKIDMANYQYIRHGYSSRNINELPVMSRWFELPLPAPLADYLVVVVYSKEQLKNEHKEDLKKKFENYEKKKGVVLTEDDKNTMSSLDGFRFELEDEDKWGVVAILGQSHQGEEPMSPITMMRNALGIEEGGSGFPLNREKYLESVEFWEKNAIVKG